MERVFLGSHHRYLVVAAVVLVAIFGIIVFSVHAHADAPVAVAGEHIISLHDSGQDIGFITKKSTLREALADAHIRIDPNDRTEPGLDEKLVAGSYQVNIYRARPVVIHDGQVETRIITAYRTGAQIAEQAGIALHDEDLTTLAPSRDPIADGAAEVMTITRATAFRFDFYGKTETAYTQAATVGAMLKEKGITMQPADGISVPLDTPITAGIKVKLWRDGVQTVTVDEKMSFTTKTIEDADQPVGYKHVDTPGKKGKRTVTYEIRVKNGVEVARHEINSIVVDKPTQQVVTVGTKVSLPAGSHEDWMAAAGMSSSNYGYINYIFTHESGWNPAAVNSAGYYGLGQTSLSKLTGTCGATWASDPVCQIKVFNSYAVGRYGSWKAAYQFKQSRGWW